MEIFEKKALLLIKAILCYHHGIQEEDHIQLSQQAEDINGQKEFKWAIDFIEKDTLSANKRGKKMLKKLGADISSANRLKYIADSWKEGMKKGYLTNIEVDWLLEVASLWKLEKKLLKEVDDYHVH